MIVSIPALAVANEERVALADGELPKAEAERLRVVAGPEPAERFAAWPSPALPEADLAAVDDHDRRDRIIPVADAVASRPNSARVNRFATMTT